MTFLRIIFSPFLYIGVVLYLIIREIILAFIVTYLRIKDSFKSGFFYGLLHIILTPFFTVLTIGEIVIMELLSFVFRSLDVFFFYIPGKKDLKEVFDKDTPMSREYDKF